MFTLQKDHLNPEPTTQQSSIIQLSAVKLCQISRYHYGRRNNHISKNGFHYSLSSVVLIFPFRLEFKLSNWSLLILIFPYWLAQNCWWFIKYIPEEVLKQTANSIAIHHWNNTRIMFFLGGHSLKLPFWIDVSQFFSHMKITSKGILIRLT